ncbi:T9SS type A sorting domain-containing protein [bacterium]|nr:T9SS type A sorting domain-containing protein [bacterium]
MRPIIYFVSPPVVCRGETCNILFSGLNFQSGATVDMGTGVDIDSVLFIATAFIRVDIAVNISTPFGPRDVIVTNPGGMADTLVDGLLIDYCDHSPPEVEYLFPSSSIEYLSCPDTQIIFKLTDENGIDLSFVELIVNGTWYSIESPYLHFEEDSLLIFEFHEEVEDGEEVSIALTGIADTVGNVDSSIVVRDDFTIDLSPPYLAGVEPEPGSILDAPTLMLLFSYADEYGEIDENSIVFEYKDEIYRIDSDQLSYTPGRGIDFSLCLGYCLTETIEVCIDSLCDRASGCSSNCISPVPVCFTFYHEAPPISEAEIILNAIHTNGFPEISLSVSPFSDLGCCIPGLDESNFHIYENGMEISDYDITLTSGSSSSICDIVLIVDDTGSMGWIIAELRTRLSDFIDNLMTGGVNFRLGLVSFKDDVDFDGTRFGLGYDLTTDFELYQEMIDALVASGGGDGPEVSLDAICDALTTLNFRAESRIVLIMITDNIAHELGDGTSYSDETVGSTVELLNDYGAVCFVFSTAYHAVPQFAGPGSITEGSGGVWFDIEDMEAAFDSIQSSLHGLMCQYLLEYTTPEPAYDGSFREVTVEFEYGEHSDTEWGGYYAPESLTATMLEPKNGCTSSDREQVILIQFEYDLDRIDMASISVRVNDELYSLYGVCMDFDDSLLIIEPHFDYEDGETVFVTLEDVEDILGRNILTSSITWHFVPDYSPPYVFEVTPGIDESVPDLQPEIIALIRDESSWINIAALQFSLNGRVFGLDASSLDWLDPETLLFKCAVCGITFDTDDTVTASVLRMCDSPDYGESNCDSVFEWSFVIDPTSVHERDNVPTKFSLGEAFPNPFNSSITISYSLPKAEHVKLAVYDILGNKVRIIVDEEQEMGYFNIMWDGFNETGEQCSSGIYFIKVVAGDFSYKKRCLLLR